MLMHHVLIQSVMQPRPYACDFECTSMLASGGDAFSILPMIMLLYLGGAFN